MTAPSSQVLADRAYDQHQGAQRPSPPSIDIGAGRSVAHPKLSSESPSSRSVSHSREGSLSRQYSSSSSNAASNEPHSITPQTSRFFGPRSRAGSGAGAGAGAGAGSGAAKGENVKQGTYGHHRQTSILHGIQHSRNGSGASTTSNPLSPEVVAPTGSQQGAHDINMAQLDNDPHPHLPSMSGNSTFSTSTTLIPERVSNSTDSVANSTAQAPRRVERRMSGRNRREHTHHRSQSRHHYKEEIKTVGEYALHVLFTSFIAQAEDKINLCISGPAETEPQTETVCGSGVDPTFDKLISALGHIASQRPKPLIDSLMLWRKNKSDAANDARTQLQQSRNGSAAHPVLSRRNTDPSASPDPMDTSVSNPSTTLAEKQHSVLLAERASTVSIYILCRVLMDVIGQSTLACITQETEDKLEGIIFLQLKIVNPEQLSMSPLKQANWFLFSQLLGVMSEINFEAVTTRFVQDLDKMQKDLVVKSPSNREVEGKMELVLGGMKQVRVKVHPEASWDQTCSFMLGLGRSFTRSHGQRLKYAYCQSIEALLLPIAARATVQLNSARWSETISTIGGRLASMLMKPRHWSVAFPLTATLLCVSSAETFSVQWLQLILPLQPRLKDRSTRAICLQVISRLLWTFLYRVPDSPAATTRKIEEVIRLILPPGKKAFISTEPAVADPLIEIIRLIGFKHQELCFRSIIFPLINADLFVPGKELKIDQLEPEKMVIGIRAFLAIMSDLEKGEKGRPAFPSQPSSIYTPQFDRWPVSPISTPSSTSSSRRPALANLDDLLSHPVATARLGEIGKKYYTRFCEILGRITMICDNAFGGQAVLDEKFNSQTPKTPIAETFNFARKDDAQSDQRQAFYDLLHVAVQALPRCLSPAIPFNSLINLLCTGTAHVQENIAASSAKSLKSIARQLHAQQVTIGFARFIFNFDDRYATMSDGGMLGPGHIENTLRLYVELLQIWIDEINQKAKGAMPGAVDSSGLDRRAAPLESSGLMAYVDEIESHGFFFLCSQSRCVRNFAVTVLRLITEFDRALGQGSTRLISILDGESVKVMDFDDERLSVAERSRLQRGLRKSNSKSALIELCSSDISYDATLWFKIFPNLMRVTYEICPFAVALGRELICNRILQIYRSIHRLAESTRSPQTSAGERFDTNGARLRAGSTTPSEVLIEQWKLYLIVACTTLSDKGGHVQSVPPAPQHLHKVSKSGPSQDKLTSARGLFKLVVPLLSVGTVAVRDAVVVALGSININIYKTLLEELQTVVAHCNDEARSRMHQRTTSSPRRNRRTDNLRTEVTHVYKLTSRFLRSEAVHQDEWILNNLVAYSKDLKIFLSDTEVQLDWEFQRLRQHYCGLMEELFEGITRTKDPSRWMTFESRKSAFALMEDWCGHSPNQTQIRQREENMRQSVISQQAFGERGVATAAMEKEKNSLRTAALSAMAALCGGPVSITTESRANLQFDIRRMLSWIDTIFATESDRLHVIGRRALVNLITHNLHYSYLLEHSISRCYLAEAPKALESYFGVVTQILLEHPDCQLPFWRMLGIALYTLGSEQSDIRLKSASVLRALEERQQRNSKIQDFDISISDKTKAVYKLAQFEISKRLSKQHSELAFLIFSEFSIYFKLLHPNAQRNMVAAILPWVQIIELQLDPNGGPTGQSYVLLTNLFEITIKSSSALHNEVQALWQALATGPHAGNVQLVLDFIISLCLDRREQNFVEYAKQIVVFLSSTPNGSKVIEFLLQQILPKAMIPNEKRETLPPPPDTSSLPYLAELSEALPIGAKQAGFSLGQLSLILLVDLIVSPVQLVAADIPLLLQVVTILWDHYTPLVQDQAREMLIHLLHEMVISKLDDGYQQKKVIEDLIDSIRNSEARVIWAYEDSNGKPDDQENNVPEGMEILTTEIVNHFELTYPGIKDQWAKLSLTWATSCPVRHLACRSFQVFRCILTSLDQTMLADMLARLSNTIADEDVEIQTFSMEILTTLKTLISKLGPSDLMTFPQLFWTTCACLDTINEREFVEGLGMLDDFLVKVDLGDPVVCRILLDGQPLKWEGCFDGILSLLYKGLRSSASMPQTLIAMERLVTVPSSDLVGGNERLLFGIWANMPRFLHAIEKGVMPPDCVKSATALAEAAETQGNAILAPLLQSFAAFRFRSENDFLSHIIPVIRDCFFPIWDFRSLVFLMSLLTNNNAWFKVKIMRILCVIIPDIDMRKPEVASHGPDLISPLLRQLQTDLCMQALEVLDNIMTMAGTPMDKHHLRMSMTRSSSKAIRKEYERTQSLFGIPDESGWAIPMPAKHADITRANVHAVFYMCQSAEDPDISAVQTPEVEFHADEFQYGYFPPSERADTMMSDEGRVEGNIGDLVMKLDSLDDFFDDGPSSPASDGRSSKTITEYNMDGFESSAQLYDEEALPILRQSLGHAPSNSSYQSGFADVRPPYMTRDLSFNAMNPGAFATEAPMRPGLHLRSVTSPSAPMYRTHTSELVSDDDTFGEVFSDGEEDRIPASAIEGSFSLQSVIRPIAQGTRSGMRRLTGGRSKENDRLREGVRNDRRGLSQPPDDSPRVPKVPTAYLQHN